MRKMNGYIAYILTCATEDFMDHGYLGMGLDHYDQNSLFQVLLFMKECWRLTNKKKNFKNV